MGPASRLCGWSPSATTKAKMKIKKKPNDTASPRLDHRLPGAATVFLCVSRRTTLLSANTKLKLGQEEEQTSQGRAGQEDEQKQTRL